MICRYRVSQTPFSLNCDGSFIGNVELNFLPFRGQLPPSSLSEPRIELGPRARPRLERDSTAIRARFEWIYRDSDFL